ncbi:MAG: flippase-like domain-containing protein [Gemmatimonadaceae bacterium]|nr:flippase-like domain-containing protein [Gemmatimonadaceae bacterium]
MPPLRWFLTFLSFATAIGVSVYVIASSWPAAGGAPLGLPWWTHLLLLGAVGFEILCRVLKIVFSARAIGVHTPFGVAARTILGGDFAASITPSRSGAEPARFLVLSEAGTAVANVLLILFLELFLEMISLAVIAVGFGVVWREESGMIRGLLATVALYAIGVLGAGAACYVIARRGANGPPPALVRVLGINAGIWRRVQLALRSLRSSIGSLRTARPGLMATALAFSILHVLARLLALPIIVYTYGERAPLSALVLWPMALLYGAAVAPAPGGGGVVEIAFKAALDGVLPGRLMAASLIWWRVYSFYIYILIGAVAAGRTVMRALRTRDDGTSAATAGSVATPTA